MLNNIFYLCIVISFFLFALTGMKRTRAGVLTEGERDYSSEQKEVLVRLNRLRGVFAIEIIIGHVFRHQLTILYPFGKFMIISAAFFFFISAFGMAYSYQHKPEYLDGKVFLSQKPFYIFLISVLFFFANSLIDVVSPLDLGFLHRNILLTYLKETNWYLFELMIFYVMFYVVYRIVPMAFRVLTITVLTMIGMLAVFFYIGASVETWYASALGFPFGLLFGQHYEKISVFLHQKKGKLFTVLLSAFGLFCLIWHDDGMIGMVFMRNAICIAGILIAWYVICHFSFDNKAIRFTTKYSLEIFLSQFIFQKMASIYQWNPALTFAFSFVCLWAMALIMHPIVLLIRKVLKHERIHIQET